MMAEYISRRDAMLVNQKALDYNAQILDSMVSSCSPFFYNSCVRSFRYFRVYEDGTYMNLSTNHEWLCERVVKIANNGKAFHRPLCSSIKNEFSWYLWENSTTDPVMQLFKKHNIAHGITAYRRLENSVEAWSFGATNEDSFAANFYINNSAFLKAFIESFGMHARDKIEGAVLAHFSSPVSISFDRQEEERDSEGRTNGGLSVRELQCLRLIGTGKTCKEIARDMGISPRTVESYMNSIRVKLGTHSKSKTAEYFWEHFSEK